MTATPNPDSDSGSDWLRALANECKATSQNKAAKRLGLSSATISLVLRGEYGADTSQIEARVRGELLNACVECPVLGEINQRVCLDWQAKPFAATNHLRVQVYRACRNQCPHSRLV